ncbi:hypothetical protein [Leptospira ainazelensis]|uniref:hypothetical protein n=1 Tax=Leptospira ainazelensis TaxID=2810034 RepID=UPI0038CC1B46
MIRILKHFIIYLSLPFFLFCGDNSNSNVLDLTKAEWKAIQGKHLDLKSEKQNRSVFNSQSIKKDKEKESLAPAEWKEMTSFPIGKFLQASSIFKQLYREEPRDNLSKIYLKRCRLYSIKPPELHWDGIFRYQTK